MSNPRDSSDQSPPQEEGGQGSQPPPRVVTGNPSGQETESPRPSHDSAAGSSRQEADQSPRQSLPLGDISHHAPEGDNVRAQGEGGEGGAAGTSRRSTPQRKRLREVTDSGGASSSSKKQPGNEPPRGPYQCSLCTRVFVNDKGLFGHMRSHPDRNWRGAYPPPVFSREEIEEDLAKVIERVSGRGGDTAAGDVAAAVTVRENESETIPELPGLDLNETPEGEEEETETSPQRPDGKAFDLNKTPPRE